MNSCAVSETRISISERSCFHSHLIWLYTMYPVTLSPLWQTQALCPLLRCSSVMIIGQSGADLRFRSMQTSLYLSFKGYFKIMGVPTIFTYLYSQKIANILTILSVTRTFTPRLLKGVQYRQIRAGLNIRFYHNIDG